MCCNFEKAARDRLVESTGIILGSHFEQPVDELNLPPNIRTAHPEMTAQPLLEFRPVALNPSPDRCVVGLQAALGEQLFDIAERQRVPKIPAHSANN